MSLTDSLQEDIAAVEKILGRKIEVGALPLIKEIAEKADIFTEIGRQHATEGCKTWTAEDFTRKANEQFGRKDVEEIVSLMHQCYLEGYKAGREAVV